MSQDWTANLYDQATEGDTTLGNMELMFATLKSMFSGAGALANTVAGMPWFDTAKKVSKRRDSGDAAWFGLMHGDVNQKIWVYRNAAMEGWAIDAAVSDKVLSLKGGATYTAGAATAGSWTISGLPSTTHNHQWYNYVGSSAAQTYNSSGSAINLGSFPAVDVSGIPGNDGSHFDVGVDSYTTKFTEGAHDGTWRAAAAVGTLQYLDL